MFHLSICCIFANPISYIMLWLILSSFYLHRMFVFGTSAIYSISVFIIVMLLMSDDHVLL